MQKTKTEDSLIHLTDKFTDILNDIHQISTLENTGQMFMLIPRLKHIQTLSDKTSEEIKADIQNTSDDLTCNVLNQQLASLEILQTQVKEMTDTINLAIFALHTSEKQKACAKAIQLANNLQTKFNAKE